MPRSDLAFDLKKLGTGWDVEDHNDVRLLWVLQAALRATAAPLRKAKLGRPLSFFTWVLEVPT